MDRSQLLSLLQRCQNGHASCLFVMECIEAEIADKFEAMEVENARLRAMVAAVQCHEFRGIECLSVDGEAWFDLQREVLKR